MYSAQDRGLSQQPSQKEGRGTRRMNASLRRDCFQFEHDELQSQLSQGNKHRQDRGGAAGQGHTDASQAERSPMNQVQASQESSAESCIIIPRMQSAATPWLSWWPIVRSMVWRTEVPSQRRRVSGSHESGIGSRRDTSPLYCFTTQAFRRNTISYLI